MTWEKSNQFGGMFGGIGALFSGLALAGVVVAIKMQKEELELQREELRETRAELHRTAEAQEKMSAASRQQVNTLVVTARLNALTAIAEYQGRLHMGGGSETILKIQTILNELDDATD